jgi:hypothetical protein
MSLDFSDVWELGAVSDCCNAGVYLNGICADCNDHCTPVYEDNINFFKDAGGFIEEEEYTGNGFEDDGCTRMEEE